MQHQNHHNVPSHHREGPNLDPDAFAVRFHFLIAASFFCSHLSQASPLVSVFEPFHIENRSKYVIESLKLIGYAWARDRRTVRTRSIPSPSRVLPSTAMCRNLMPGPALMQPLWPGREFCPWTRVGSGVTSRSCGRLQGMHRSVCHLM